jgi:hypothetical protein
MDRNVLVEVTSEEKAHPIESALLPDENENCGWRAANPGTQIIRFIFDEPQTLRRIWLVFEDTKNTRTQARPAMVAGSWPFFPRNRSPTVEFQLTGFRAGGRRLHC